MAATMPAAIFRSRADIPAIMFRKDKAIGSHSYGHLLSISIW
jgi:hypothetical protein